MLIAQPAFPHYVDTDGSPITSGSLYYGTAGANPRTSPIAIYWDAAGTQPAHQPVRTVAGYPVRNGSPANVYVNGAYSVALYNAGGELVFYAPDSAAYDAVLSATSPFMRTLLDDADAATARATLGAASLGANTFTGAQTLAGNAANALEAVPKQQLDAAVSGVASALSFSSLGLSATGASANISVSANELLLRASDGSAKLVSGVSLTINSAGAAANGLDTGSLAGNTWYAVWVINNGTTTAGLLSLSGTSPTLPSGYTHKARIGWIRTDATANKFPISFQQLGRSVQYVVSSTGNLNSLRVMSSGVQGSVGTPTWVAVSTSAFVPSTASAINLVARTQNSNVSIAPNNSYGPNTSSTNPPPFSFSTTNLLFMSATTLRLESSDVYWASDASAGSLYCLGWEDNL